MSDYFNEDFQVKLRRNLVDQPVRNDNTRREVIMTIPKGSVITIFERKEDLFGTTYSGYWTDDTNKKYIVSDLKIGRNVDEVQGGGRKRRKLHRTRKARKAHKARKTNRHTLRRY